MPNNGQSPYSTKFVSGQIDYDLDPSTQMREWKKEERETHQAPNTLPFEMANLPEYYASVIDNAFQASKTIEAILKTKDVKNKESLYKLMKNTEKIVIYLLQTVDSTLEQYSIGTSHMGDDRKDYEDEIYQ